MEAKASKTPLQKNINKMIPRMNPNWPKGGSQNGSKMDKNDVLGGPCLKGGPQVAPRAPPGSILDRFWDHFRQFVQHMFNDFCMHSVAAYCKQTRSNITRSHQNNAAESFQETAPLFVPSCIEQFTSER